MASADFCMPSRHLSMSVAQGTPCRSPRVLRTHLHAYACRIYAAAFRTSIRALHVLAFSPRCVASYPLPVRQASALPSASFRFAVARDTLAVQLTLPLVGCVEDFHLQVSAPCRAHKEKAPTELRLNSNREDNHAAKFINYFLFREPITFHLLIRFMNKRSEHQVRARPCRGSIA